MNRSESFLEIIQEQMMQKSEMRTENGINAQTALVERETFKVSGARFFTRAVKYRKLVIFQSQRR